MGEVVTRPAGNCQSGSSGSRSLLPEADSRNERHSASLQGSRSTSRQSYEDGGGSASGRSVVKPDCSKSPRHRGGGTRTLQSPGRCGSDRSGQKPQEAPFCPH